MATRVLLLAPADDAGAALRARRLRDAGAEVVRTSPHADGAAAAAEAAAVAVQEDVARVEVPAALAPAVRRALDEAGAEDVEVAALPGG